VPKRKRKNKIGRLVAQLQAAINELPIEEQEIHLATIVLTLLINSDLNLFQCLGVLTSTEKSIWEKAEEKKLMVPYIS